MRIWVLCLFVALFLTGCKRTVTEAAIPNSLQISAPGVDAAEPTTATSADGTFYVAWANHDAKQADIMIARFNTSGEMQDSPVRVNRQPGVATAWRGDQPSVAVAEDGSVFVVWTARVDAGDKHGTDIYLSVSNDRAHTFSSEVKINDDKVPGPHGMHSLAVAKDGRIYVSWLDERNIQTPKPSTKGEGHHMESNRDLFIAHSTDGGRTFSPNRKVASEACPCCKTSLAVADDGTLYAGWRKVLPGSFRHIAVVSSQDGGTTFSSPKIVSDDRWVLQGCPVSGPSLSVDPSGGLVVLWYAAGEANAPGLYISQSVDKARSFSQRQLVSQEVVRGTPIIAPGGNNAVVFWQAADTTETKAGILGNPFQTLKIATNAELPAGVVSNGRMFVTYIAKDKEKRTVWITKV